MAIRAKRWDKSSPRTSHRYWQRAITVSVYSKPVGWNTYKTDSEDKLLKSFASEFAHPNLKPCKKTSHDSSGTLHDQQEKSTQSCFECYNKWNSYSIMKKKKRKKTLSAVVWYTLKCYVQILSYNSELMAEVLGNLWPLVTKVKTSSPLICSYGVSPAKSKKKRCNNSEIKTSL